VIACAFNQRAISASDYEAGLGSVSEGKRPLLNKVSELSFQMLLFRSAPDTLIEDHSQVRSPLFYDSGEIARKQVPVRTDSASVLQAYTRVWVEQQIAT
jgi:hypothetical protein